MSICFPGYIPVWMADLRYQVGWKRLFPALPFSLLYLYSSFVPSLSFSTKHAPYLIYSMDMFSSWRKRNALNLIIEFKPILNTEKIERFKKGLIRPIDHR
jgi:hypothetical protein